MWVRVTYNGRVREVWMPAGSTAGRVVQRARDPDVFGIRGGPALALFTPGGVEITPGSVVSRDTDLVLRPAVIH